MYEEKIQIVTDKMREYKLEEIDSYKSTEIADEKANKQLAIAEAKKKAAGMAKTASSRTRLMDQAAEAEAASIAVAEDVPQAATSEKSNDRW